MTVIGWQRAWQQALYGDGGFYLRGPGPAAHFRTASHAAPGLLAAAVARLAEQEGCTAVLEIAAGRGELAAALARHAPATHAPATRLPATRLTATHLPATHLTATHLTAGSWSGLGVTALDLVPRPDGLPAEVAWVQGSAPGDALTTLDALARWGELQPAERVLVMAWEWLDVVACPVVEVDEDGAARLVLVAPRTGAEELGDCPDPADQEWLAEWWPLDAASPGDRAEVGRPRDQAWAALVTGVRELGLRGALLTVDYDHQRTARPPGGSLSGFRAGRQVPPRPDGSCDLTAHVALDAVQAAGERAGATTVTLTRQAEALRALDVGSDDPGANELLDPGGLGGFGWLLQRV